MSIHHHGGLRLCRRVLVDTHCECTKVLVGAPHRLGEVCCDTIVSGEKAHRSWEQRPVGLPHHKLGRFKDLVAGCCRSSGSRDDVRVAIDEIAKLWAESDEEFMGVRSLGRACWSE